MGTMAMETMDIIDLDTESEPDWCHFLFPGDTQMPVIKGKWRRTQDGEIEAWYSKAEAEMCMVMIR